MVTQIVVPDFQFSGFYYPQLLEELMQFKRRNTPELTDESAYEPSVQFMRAFALVGHLNNTLIDLVALESTLPTAKNPESVRNMLRLIDYEMKSAAPATVDIVYELSKVFTAAFEVVSANAQCATVKQGDEEIIFFEALTALTIDRTDQCSWVYACESDVFTDVTSKANTAASGADNWTPWATPAVRDAIYIGHNNILWVQTDVQVITPGANFLGVWEYYDGNFRKKAPSSVTNLGASLEIDLTSYLGSTNRAGTAIRVELNSSAAYEDVVSTWDGSTNIATVGFLGQSSPSTDETKYTVGSDWEIIDDVNDTTAHLTGTGVVTYTLPQTLTKDWITGTVNGQTAYWLRFRIVSVSGPTAVVLRGIEIDGGKQFVVRLCTQGQTVADDPLGNSTGLANQRFETTRDYFITGSETVTVDDVEWLRVDNFLDSESTDKHYTVELGKNDRASIVFGDGVSGKIPPVGVGNVSAAYRNEANDDGNVGALTVTVDKTGLSYVNKLYNPRGATGWTVAEGATEASLERVKIEGPASLRVKFGALGPADLIQLTRAYEAADGSRPFARAKAVEEGFGPKTVEIIVVPNGGALASGTVLDALELYFNGDPDAIPPVEKRFVANQEVVATNYTPKVIDITATVEGSVLAAAIENRLQQVFQPDALREDGVTFEWEFGGTVPVSRIIHEIFSVDDTNIRKVTVTVPAADVVLQSRELPEIGTITLVIV